MYPLCTRLVDLKKESKMFGYEFNLDKDQIYWFFSSSSQSIAAFIALLLTGYAFVVNVMDNLEARDETLAEVHTSLKISYYRQLKLLALVGGFTVIASLTIIFVNFYLNWVRSVLLIPTAISIVLTLVLGVRFIIEIVDPQKYSKKATFLLEEEEKSIPKEGTEVSIGEFMDSFISLERLIREICEEFASKPALYPTYYKQAIPRSLVEIVTNWYRSELMHKEEFDILKEIIKTRNLVVHGERTEIDKTWLNWLEQSTDIVENVRKRWCKRVKSYADMVLNQKDEPDLKPVR